MSHSMDHESASRKIFIGGLSYSTDEDKLRDYFEKFGPVQDAVVMKDPVTKRSRGFGFITFDASIYVDIALEQDVHIIDSRKVEAKRAVPRSEVLGSSKDVAPVAASSGASKSAPSPPVAASPVVVHTPAAPSTNHSNSTSHDNNSSKYNSEDYAYHKIFVGGLHYDTRDAEFRSYFELYGRVLSAEVMFNRETHKSRGFGFIIFEKESSVDLVCEERDHIIDGKMVEVKRAVPRTKGPMAGPSASASKPHPPGSVIKSSTSSGSASKTGGSVEASIGVKKPVSAATKTATNVAIASVGMRSKPPPAKSVNTSYAAALRAGHNDPEPETTADPMESEYPPLVPSKPTVAAALEPPEPAVTAASPVRAGSVHSSPMVSASAASPKLKQSSPQVQPQSQYLIRSPKSLPSPANGGLPPPNMGGTPPDIILPQTVISQGPAPQEQLQLQPNVMSHQTQDLQPMQQLPLPGPPQRGYTQPHNHSEYEGFDINRPARALSESFVPQNYPNQVPGMGGYYGNVMNPGPGGHRDAFGTGGGVYSHPRTDSLGEAPASNLYENPPHGLPLNNSGSYENKYDFMSGNQFGGLGWLPASLSAGGARPSHNSELDTAGEDAIGLGLALSMDLNDIQPQGQFGSSRVVNSEGRFESQRSRGPAPSYLPGDNRSMAYNGPASGAADNSRYWNSGGSGASGLPPPAEPEGNNSGSSFGGASQEQQEWYPQLHDLRSSAAEFKPTSGSSGSNSNSSMPWLSPDH